MDAKLLRSLLGALIQKHVQADAWQWLNEKAAAIAAEEKAMALNNAFAALPRKTGTTAVTFAQKEWETFLHSDPPLYIRQWTIDRLCRVWLLLFVADADREAYIRKIESLFSTASMNEQVALYSALPLLSFPEAWQHRCAEGVRSNIGTVLEAIMCYNVYPSKYLPDPAWNQLVLKAFFTDKPVQQIVGLEQRCNAELARVLTDYAHERWAAGRSVNPQLWRCVAPFTDAAHFDDIRRLSQSDSDAERAAAVLVCRQSNYAPCKDLLQSAALASFAADENLTWQTIAGKANAAV